MAYRVNNSYMIWVLFKICVFYVEYFRYIGYLTALKENILHKNTVCSFVRFAVVIWHVHI
jgi:hypothetical protein